MLVCCTTVSVWSKWNPLVTFYTFSANHHSTGIWEPNIPCTVFSDYAHVFIFNSLFYFFCGCTVASHHYLPSHVVLCRFRRKGAAQDMSNVSETVLASSWPRFPHVRFSDTSNDRKQSILTSAGAVVLHGAAVNHLSTGSPLRKRGSCLCQSLVLNLRGDNSG